MKIMKLPNGYGSVYKLPGKRRNPYRAIKTGEWIFDKNKDKLIQKRFTVGYFPTKQEALQALANYNENPYDIKRDGITFSELYDKWSEEHFQSIVPSAKRSWKSAYNYCEPLYQMRMKDIRVVDLEGTIKDAKVGDTTKARMKSLFNLMYRFALKHEIVDKDYAQLCNPVKRPPRERDIVPFSNDEIQNLWDNIDFPFVDMILIGIYSGWRPQELSTLKTSNVDLENKTMLGGLKTDAGKNRYVPIHPKTYNLIKERYDCKNEYLFNDENSQQGTSMTYDKYRGRFNKVMKHLNMKHHPHETRHTFITKAKDANMDEYILKLIVGHAIQDVTEKVYTHRTMEQLQNEIIKIPN
jgi:integrase